MILNDPGNPWNIFFLNLTMSLVLYFSHTYKIWYHFNENKSNLQNLTNVLVLKYFSGFIPVCIHTHIETHTHKYTTYTTSASSANYSEAQASKAYSFSFLSCNSLNVVHNLLIFCYVSQKWNCFQSWVLFSVTMTAIYISWIKLHLKYNLLITICMCAHVHTFEQNVYWN